MLQTLHFLRKKYKVNEIENFDSKFLLFLNNSKIEMLKLMYNSKNVHERRSFSMAPPYLSSRLVDKTFFIS